MSYLVIGQGRWGHDAQLEKARRNWRGHGGVASGGYTIVEFPAPLEFQGIDEMGRVHWTGSDSGVQPIETVRKAKK